MSKHALAGLIAGLAALAPLPGRAADQSLIDAAKKEGAVTWYTTAIVDQFVRPAVAAFEAKYAELDRLRARRERRMGLAAAALAAATVAACCYADAFSLRRYADALPTILQLAEDALPPRAPIGRSSTWSK